MTDEQQSRREEQPQEGSAEQASPWARPGSPVHVPVPPAPTPVPAYPQAYPPPGYPQAYPPPGYPAGYGPPGYGQPAAYGPPVPRDAYQKPSRIEPVPDTPYGLAYLSVPSSTSGPAIGSLVSGIGAILVSLVVICFGAAGTSDGWGGWVAGAFAVLGVLVGLAAIGLGLTGLRQVRRAPLQAGLRVTGRGLAIAGLTCGSVGTAITLLALFIVLLVQAS